jgi:hypothetical protein
MCPSYLSLFIDILLSMEIVIISHHFFIEVVDCLPRVVAVLLNLPVLVLPIAVLGVGKAGKSVPSTN